MRYRAIVAIGALLWTGAAAANEYVYTPTGEDYTWLAQCVLDRASHGATRDPMPGCILERMKFLLGEARKRPLDQQLPREFAQIGGMFVASSGYCEEERLKLHLAPKRAAEIRACLSTDAEKKLTAIEGALTRWWQGH